MRPAVEIELCQKFIACRHNPNTEYISPQRRIDELEKELKEVNEQYNNLINLLKKRFPPNPDGSLPDFKVENVLQENQTLKEMLKKIAHLKGATQLLEENEKLKNELQMYMNKLEQLSQESQEIILNRTRPQT